MGSGSLDLGTFNSQEKLNCCNSVAFSHCAITVAREKLSDSAEIYRRGPGCETNHG